MRYFPTCPIAWRTASTMVSGCTDKNKVKIKLRTLNQTFSIANHKCSEILSWANFNYEIGLKFMRFCFGFFCVCLLLLKCCVLVF